MPECFHHVDQSFCGYCRKLPRPTDPAGIVLNTYALMEENCDRCQERIRVGDRLVLLTTDERVHGGCVAVV